MSAARIASAAFTIVAVLLLIAAVYAYFVPLHVVSGQGGLFGCGSAAEPPQDGFQKGVCMNIAQVSLYRAIGLLVAALATGLLSFLLLGGRGFGARPADADDDDDFDAPRPRGSARGSQHDLFGPADPVKNAGTKVPREPSESSRRRSGGSHADDDAN